MNLCLLHHFYQGPNSISNNHIIDSNIGGIKTNANTIQKSEKKLSDIYLRLLSLYYITQCCKQRSLTIKAAVQDDKLAVLNKIKPIYCNPLPVKTEIPLA